MEQGPFGNLAQIKGRVAANLIENAGLQAAVHILAL
jgi:hypothetical protein